ncbi:MAG: nagB [Bacilli bacterium]|jgi:glucosamine-6-phosphate deaminase|nr:nagB [Bacilli bacterium]
MDIQVFATNPLLNSAAADLIASLLQAKPTAVLGLATGGTPVGIYAELVKRHQKQQLSFNEATSFNLDEYVGLPESHEQSYHAYMQQHLFNHIDLPARNINIPNGNAASIEQECLRYDELLDEIQQIDLQILGIGHNGHIGFNEPSTNLTGGTHIVELKEETRLANARYFNHLDDVPTHAITMGLGGIMKAKCLLLVVRGAEKASIIHEALTGPITTQIPASLLQTHPNLIVMLDPEAGVKF